MLNKDNVAVCCTDEIVLNWGDDISHLYYDQDADVEVVAFRMLDSINNSTSSQWGREDVYVQTDYELRLA